MFLPLLLALSANQSADTLAVPHAQVEGPFTIQQPYTTESKNMNDKTFDIKEALKQNESIVLKSRIRKTSQTTINKGETLTLAQDSLPTLRYLYFDLQATKFVKGQFLVENLKDYKLFVNGEECVNKQFTMTPGRMEVALQVLTQKGNTDLFNVKIVGDDLSGIEINSKNKRPYTIADMVQGEHYQNVALSPSGKYLVTVSYYTRPNGSNQYTTVLSELKTGRELFHKNEYLSLNWLQSSKDVLYYTRNSGTGKELVVYNPETGTEKVLADRLPEGSFQIAPNEEYLIFSKTESGKTVEKGIKRIQEPDDRIPGWRNRNSLWRYDLKTGITQRLTFGSSSVYLSDISDDSKSLLLQYSHVATDRSPFTRTSILRMDAYTGKVDTLINDTTYLASAKFSPDATQLLISATPFAFDKIGCEVKPGQVPNGFDYRLYLYDIASKKATPLLRNFAPSVETYEWSRGNNLIYFAALDGANRSLFSLDIKKSEVKKFNLPVTFVQRYSIATASNKPQVVFFGQSAERAREMFVSPLDKTTPKAQRIGTINFDDLYDNVAIGTCHDWKFKATRGDSIDGFYFLPPHFDSNKQYPLIVYYYGGCMPSFKGLEFHYPFQVLAGQGYVVYVLNPSGAVGYGQEFAARHVNTWGQESGDDIIEGTKKFCKEHSFIDPKRIGCMGASYGGFMTQYLQTRTDLFATAISHAGISNITSYWGGGYWGYSYGEVAQFESYPWNNPELYVKQSPLFNADKIHTPLLLLHGTADTNVPTNESQQLFTALKILGRDVSYVQIEGENHVIVDYNKRLAWQEIIFAWFAKYLQKDSTWWDSLNL